MDVASVRRSAAVGFALAAVVLLGWLFLRPRPGMSDAPEPVERHLPPDPRLAYDGPYRNVHPDAKYVGDAACADCHLDIARTYRQHAMGRSLAPAARVALPEDAAHHNPFEAFGARFRVEHDGGRVRHRRTSLAADADGWPIYDTAFDVAYAVGSGTRGHSFFAVRDGYVFQTPVSWYAQQAKWDISPGFSVNSLAGRPVERTCLFCHANRAEPVEGTVNRFKEPVFDGHAIGCERCHGPGEPHVAARSRAEALPDPDPTVVNPRRLAPALREAVCEQCHLEGQISVVRRGRALHDFRPGLALQDFVTVFVTPDEGQPGDERAVSHVEQMHVSRCFRASDGRLGCVSCHDPHVRLAPERRVEHYRKACLECHATRGCSVPEAERRKTSAPDSCVQCHMPRYATSDVPHTASTDHRIPRRKLAASSARASSAPRGLPVVPFHRQPFDPRDGETARDLGIALMRLAEDGRFPAASQCGAARGFLDPAVENDPEDWEACEARALALKAQGLPVTALEALEEVLAKAPRREMALADAGLLAEDLGRFDRAETYWRRAVEVNPYLASYRRKLARVLSRKEAWAEARAQADEWLRLDPASVEARALRVSGLLHAGDRPGAEAEFAALEALRPENLNEFRAWYQNESLKSKK